MNIFDLINYLMTSNDIEPPIGKHFIRSFLFPFSENDFNSVFSRKIFILFSEILQNPIRQRFMASDGIETFLEKASENQSYNQEVLDCSSLSTFGLISYLTCKHDVFLTQSDVWKNSMFCFQTPNVRIQRLTFDFGSVRFPTFAWQIRTHCHIYLIKVI